MCALRTKLRAGGKRSDRDRVAGLENGLRAIEAFKLFDVVFLLTEGGPGTSTETIAVYVYRVAFQYVKTSESAALAYILLFTVIALTNLYLYFANRRAKEA